MFPIIEVDRRQAESIEPLGTKGKFWYTDGDGRRMLFKAEERGTGEDWAEKIVCELANRLGLPCVQYELAFDPSRKLPGVICENCAPRPTQLILGNQLLLGRDPSYPSDERRKYKVQQHTIAAAADAVATLYSVPAPWSGVLPDSIDDPLDVFAGYLMLDAWVANQDRHHENWGALWQDGRLHLAPTFDHGASLARNLSDEERRDRLNSQDAGRRIPHFAARARSAFYACEQSVRPMPTIEAWQMFSGVARKGSVIWPEQLAGIDDQNVAGVLNEIPQHRLSSVAKDFTMELLRENKRRILGGDEK